MKLDEKFWVADIVFEDGFKLPNCAIFNEEPYRGQLALNDKDSIEAKFKKFPWYARGDGYIFFQNRNINGYFHVKNVSNYVIKEVTAKDHQAIKRKFYLPKKKKGDWGLINKYKIIYADPPWFYKKGVHDGVYQDGDRNIRSVVQHYPTMSKEELEQLHIPEIADKDCIIFMWVTDSHLDQGLQLIQKWGFKYKTIGFVWVKKTKNNKTCANVGAWTMKNCEICLIGTKGQMSKYKKNKNIYQLIEAERTIHSKKPDEARKRIEQIFGDIPKIELFAREKVDGWDSWGNEVNSDIQLINRQ